MHEFLVSAAAFIVLIGVMVVVHEFGHFIVAKLCKVRVEAFSFGFGPRLFGWKYGDTDYKVCLIPAGGYVKMTGENPGDNLELNPDRPEGLADGEPDPGAFDQHPRWQRMLIGLAGPMANFVLAFVIMIFYFGWINEVPKYEVKTSNVEWVVPGSAAAQAGVQPGDVIRRIENADNPTWEKVFERLKMNSDQTVALSVERGGAVLPLNLHVPAAAKTDDFDLTDSGLLPQFQPGPLGIKDVPQGTPAYQAGLRGGDAIQSVDGLRFHTVTTLLAYLQSGKGQPVNLVVLRAGQTIPMVVHPAKLDADWKLGIETLPIPYSTNPLPLGRAVAKSGAFCKDNSTLILEVLHKLFTHKVAVSQLSGPVGIARMAGEAAEMKGWFPKFGLAGEISLNLGIINLLPFPILDGGLILFLLIESLIRRDIGVAVKERVYQAAFVVLMAFFAFIIFNDLTKLPIFVHLKP
jgi:regulator of sigma E protease